VKQYAAVFMLVIGLTLTGCAQAATTVDAGGSASTPASTAESAPTPSSTPTAKDSITVGVDALVTIYDGQSVTYPYTEPEPLLDFVAEITGLYPEGEDITDPWGNGDVWGTTYTWNEISVSVMTDGPAGVRITASAIGGVPVTTAQGIAVGSASDDVVAAGGWETWNDGVSYYFGVDPQPVEGTQSLSRPGELGQAYVEITTVDGVVTAIFSPANDYSDL